MVDLPRTRAQQATTTYLQKLRHPLNQQKGKNDYVRILVR